ncbi:MAG TPA: DUF418 domain-containing protein [Fimbriimonadaceae bacterium]|nr:DUF418 domain-containing protein [Fimbriimonadaceae bacterium]
MAPVQPTVKTRIPSLDLARGVAILGILLANIAAFSLPEMAEQMGERQEVSLQDTWVIAFTNVFVSGKFRSMLAILFGAGLWLQFQKRSKLPDNWPGGYLKRTIFLGLIGLIHGYLIWFGDILASYAITALIVTFLVGLNPSVQKNLVIAGYAISAFFGLLAAVLMLAIGGGNSAVMFDALSASQELSAYAHGSYLDQFTHRAWAYTISLSGFPLLLPHLISLFLLGILLARSGALAAPSRNPRVRRLCLSLGFCLGLPLNLLALLQIPMGENPAYQYGAEFLGGPLLAPGYLMLLAMWSESGFLPRLKRILANVGRVALSAYLLQSILATFLFYSWGLGWYGQLDHAGLLVVVLLIWGVAIIGANLWVKWFELGPVEWLWRSLTEGIRLPIRKERFREESQSDALPLPDEPRPGFQL